MVFIHKNEDFKCQNCGFENHKAQRYIRDHCQNCLCSLHVDIEPGDRKSDCRGLMMPIAFKVGGKTGYKIFYKCRKCAYKHWNMMLPDDNMDAMVNLKPYHEA